MADGADAEPQHPYKRFRGDYGQSDEEQQSNPPDDEVEPVNEHRSPRQPTDQIYLPDSTMQHPLRFPDNCTDEGYLVLRNPEAEETVKSKPRGAAAKRRPSETTTTTTDGSSSDAGVTMDSQSKPRRRSSKRSRTPDNGTGDDDTGSETSVVVKPSAVNLVESHSPINSRMCCIGRVRHSYFCSGVSRWLRSKHHDPIPLRIIGTQRLPRCGVKVSNFLLYCRGLDEDFDQRYGTLTATICFLANSCICQQLLKFYNCTVKLTVETFEESVEHGRKLGTASAERQLKSDERNCLSMPITVHRVVDLDHIVYSNTCPDEIYFRITVDFDATSMFSLSESGMDDFLEVSVSSI